MVLRYREQRVIVVVRCTRTAIQILNWGTIVWVLRVTINTITVITCNNQLRESPAIHCHAVLSTARTRVASFSLRVFTDSYSSRMNTRCSATHRVHITFFGRDGGLGKGESSEKLRGNWHGSLGLGQGVPLVNPLFPTVKVELINQYGDGKHSYT